jgi:hypothetical protein
MQDILITVVICFLLFVSFIIAFVAYYLRHIAFSIRKIMETFIVMQLTHSELNERLGEIRLEIYGIGPTNAIMRKNQREHGG